MRLQNHLIATLGFLVFAAANSFAASVKTPHVEAEIISRDAAVMPGQPIDVALRLKIIDHWHTYWRNPGDSGLPTKLTWSLPTGITAGEIRWPYPKKLPLGPLMNFGYEGEALHLVTLQTQSGSQFGQSVTLKAKAEWLVCSDVCIPESADLAITLPVVNTPPLRDPRWEKAFVAANAALPGTIKNWTSGATAANGQFTLVLTPPPSENFAPTEVAFYPFREEVIANAGRQIFSKTGGELRLTIPFAEPANLTIKSLDGVLVSQNGWGTAHPGKAVEISAPVSYVKTSSSLSDPKTGAVPTAKVGPNGREDLGLAIAMLFAFVGGLILNLMPCVFPVLGIKVMSFVQQSEGAPKRMKQQGFAFLGGVVVSFWVLAGLLIALRAGGESIGWGFQLQSPAFVTLLAGLFLLMALNLSGVFEFGMRLQAVAGNLHAAGNRSFLLDAFFSGVLATIIATPCTAPFMGAALGYTLAQPASVSLLVFTSVALGMASPIVVLSLFPGWLRYLPKPGVWMNTFKQFMAFPLFATVAWLAWVLGSQQGTDGIGLLLFGMVVIAFGAWLYGRWQIAHPVRASVAAISLLVAGAVIAWPGPIMERAQSAGLNSPADAWVPFSKQKVNELRGQGRAVFIDFTATWCITCQVNKRIALNNNEVVARFNDLKITRMKADWTVKDPAITEALAEFGRNGVPLYVYYPAGGEARLLPEVLTPSVVLSALGSSGVATAAK
ncbi:MAG: thioredoxin family protein [Burkholderiales bacterium]|nr:thioredoxin family protein [Burkholderiales bacterium]